MAPVHRLMIVSLLVFMIVPQGFSAVKGESARRPLKVVSHIKDPNRVPKTPANSEYLPDRVIVKLKPAGPPSKTFGTFGVSSLDRFTEKYGSTRSIAPMFPESAPPQKDGSVDLTKIYVMKFTAPLNPFKVAEEISQQPGVEYAEPWFIYRIDATEVRCTPNDPSWNLQWGMQKILADSAWCIEQGDTNVVIGIIDTGVQTDHPDLVANIWQNPGEMGKDSLGRDKSTNGVDDDGDGKIDDYQGWDFGGADFNAPVEDNDPAPKNSTSSHGTHVAGIAAASTNNGVGVAGVGYKCRILPVKTSSDNDTRGGGAPYIIFGFQGIQYAADRGAKVISCSWGGGGASQFEQDVVNYATQKGSIVVAAAGNTYDGSYSYPASYDNVLSVAATNQIDIKSAYSSYNYSVDVSAPGGDGSGSGQIYSTLYPSTYAYEQGTSMATPHVSGLIALVASHFPGYTGLQAGEQVRVNSDNIYTIPANQIYQYKIGKGRINAVRALTGSSPSLRLLSFDVSDSIGGNNNGILEPGESFIVTAQFKNYLQPTSSGATITLSSADASVQVLNGSFPIGSVPTNGTVDNSASPFQLKVSGSAPSTHTASLVMTISDGSYSDFQGFSILVNPTFATHNVNKVAVTFTNNGRIGFNDFPNNSQGAGFTYPAPNGANQLFEGGLIIGNSATKLVDCVRNPNTSGNFQDSDFTSKNFYVLQPGHIAAQEGTTSFTDSSAPALNRLGVNVTMTTYAFTTPADSNYVIARYDVQNISGSTLNGVYIGLFMDWDMQPQYYTNQTAFDATRSLGYAWDTSVGNPIYGGVRALEGASGYQALTTTSADVSRGGKWSWISNGVATSDSVTDINLAISSGPYTILPGATQRVGFALIGGSSLADLQVSADSSLVKWILIKNLDAVGENPNLLPREYSLAQNYPNPFNPSTTISYELPRRSLVQLKIYSVLGSEVATLVNRNEEAGKYSVQFNAGGLSSGMYFYKLTAGTYSAVRKLVLLK